MSQELDTVTRLPGRDALLDRLGDETARAERYGVPLSLLLADVSGFQALEQARGVDGGRMVLRRIALSLLSSVRESDTVARVGTDKFAVLLPDTDGAGALAKAGRLSEEIAAMDMSDDGPPLFVTVSVGLATFGPGLAESGALMTHAEEALRMAKQAVLPEQPSSAVRAFPEGDADAT